MPSQSSIEDFTQRTFQTWEVGQKGRNNGVVFFVFVDDHRMRIQPGYGLEGTLPDITCNEFIRDAVAPRFRAKDFEGGLAAGIDLIFQAIRGEYKGSGKTVRESESGSSQSSTAGLLVFFFVLAIILLAVRASRRLGGYRYTGGGGPFISGNWGSGGGGWSSGGGGFSGFSGGGGSSGGGGASGSW